mgnify:FL=1|jgi:hypothetical protein|tara:strand:+ start:3605 stop:4333 length:729 start_codon:yes stop_codon:yes gene_type:complete
MIKILLIITLFCYSFRGVSQKEDIRDHTIGYHHIFYGGLQLNTHGWGGEFRRGYHKTVKTKNLIDFQISTLKHPREIKLLPSDGSDGFTFAKLNHAYTFRLGKGKHTIIAFKPFGEGVELKTIYSFGMATTILKPVYYLMVYGNDSEVSVERFNEDQHDLFNIYGPGPYFKGFNELQMVPGIFGKFALNFEYAAERTSIRSMEVGAIIDGYYKNVDLLAFANNYPIYVSLYLSLQYGKKWYR